jgi:hypothetical protein
MYSAATSVWAGGAAAFVISFFIMDFALTWLHVFFWWTIIVTTRLLCVETVRFVLLRKRILKYDPGETVTCPQCGKEFWSRDPVGE